MRTMSGAHFLLEPVIQAARALYRASLRVGVVCWVCDRHQQIRPRSIRAAQALCLKALVRAHERGQMWAHTRELGPKPGGGFSCPDFPTLKHWGFLIPMPGKCDPRKHTSGYWGVTQLAIDWVYGRVTVPRYVDVLDDRVTGTSENDRVCFDDARGTQFDYTEMVSSVTPRELALPE
jgi:hypothetical protein